MNAQDFGEPINPSENVKQADQDANGPALNSDTNAVGLMEETIAHEAPVGETAVHAAPVSESAAAPAAFLSREESGQLRTRWNEIQGKFVDEPRAAVQQADELVSEVVQKIIKMFASEHSSLESQWNQGSDVSTEDLRKVLVQYRSFFNRLIV